MKAWLETGAALPDDRHVFAACIAEYQARDRRFGGAEDRSSE